MEKELKLKTVRKPFQTKIEVGFDYVLSEYLPKFIETSERFPAIITDDAVAKIYKEQLKYLGAPIFTFPAGEGSKTREVKAMLEDDLLTHNFGRDTMIISLGGGVVGDLTGFLAATYLRGVPHIHIPTSLLAMVDAALGGKTAVNTPYGKNSIGAIYPADEIWIDGKFLETLTQRQWNNGTIELIKAGLIDSPALFQSLFDNAQKWKKKEMDFVMDRIYEGLLIKKEVVEEDPTETLGLRRTLNFGHTFGHALEILENFQLQHGEAVVVGIMVASYMSKELGYLSDGDFQKIEQIFSLYEIPIVIHHQYDIEQIMKIFARDKKAIKGTPRFVLLEEIGKAVPFDGEYCTTVNFEVLEKATHWMNEQFFRPAQ